MDELTADDVKQTIRLGQGRCVSLFMPTHRAGRMVEQDRIRFKNLVRRAEEQLILLGLRAPDAKLLLEQARRLLDEGIFWEHESDGLAVFVSQDAFRYYRVRLPIAELVVTGPRFHTKPLLPLLEESGEFYVLALSQSRISLFRQTRFSAHEVELLGVPRSLEEAIAYEHPERQTQFRTAVAGRAGGHSTLYHGHGGRTEDARDLIFKHFRRVDETVRRVLAADHSPLVLAGVEYLLPIYREASTYPHLVEGGLIGNPDELGTEELHRGAWEIVRPDFEAARDLAQRRYEQLAGGRQASNDIEEAVSAACAGRADTVFVALDLQVWGRMYPESCATAVHREAIPGDEDLLDTAASHAIMHGGRAYAVPVAEVPGGGPVAAVYRY